MYSAYVRFQNRECYSEQKWVPNNNETIFRGEKINNYVL